MKQMRVVLMMLAVLAIGSVSLAPDRQAEPFEDAAFWLAAGEQRLQQTLGQLNAEGNTAARTARNVIIVIGDGMGMASITAGRIFKGQQHGRRGENENLAFDEFANIGLAKTYNVNKQVPDSAGTATALFTGVKTNFGVIGMDATLTTNATSILGWAQAAGKRTGFVTTTRITHATPAALYAHTPNRNWECAASTTDNNNNNTIDIGRQLIEMSPGNRLNVMLGGGRIQMGAANGSDTPSPFHGAIERSCRRQDDRNLVDEWLAAATSDARRCYVRTTVELLTDDIGDCEQLLGLFADNHMSFDSIRDRSAAGEPSLAEMTAQALVVLQRHNHNGFVLMIEGGRIDQAHHQNHARLALEEIVALDDAIAVAMAATDRTDTLIIVTADHSHAITLNGYPERGNDILGLANGSNGGVDVQPYETLTYANGPGYWQHRDNGSASATWRRIELMTAAERLAPTYQHRATMPLEDETHGGEDVPVYACGPGAQLIRGTFEQNYVAHVMSFAGCMGPARRLNVDCV